MTTMNWKNFPIFLLLLLFIVDKLFLLPPVVKLFVKNEVNSYQTLFDLQERFYKDFLENKSKELGISKEETEKKSIIFFGTSRSADFSSLSKEIYLNNPYLKNPEATSAIPVISQYVRAAPFLHIYRMYDHYIKTHSRPRLVVFELNYTYFNKNVAFRQNRDIQDISISDFLEEGSLYSRKDFLEYIASRVFVLNSLNVKWDKALKGNDSDVNQALDFVMALKKINDLKNKKAETGMIGFEEKEGFLPAENLEINKWVINTFYQNYEKDTTSWNLFVKMLKEAKSKNVNLVIFIPRTHKSLQEATLKYRKGEQVWMNEVKAITNDLGIPIFNFESEIKLQCNYFADTSHYSKSCFPEIIEKIDELTMEPKK